jgi:hypothetical protein
MKRYPEHSKHLHFLIGFIDVKLSNKVIIMQLIGGDLSEVYNYQPQGKGDWIAGKDSPSEFKNSAIQNHCAVRY